MSFDIIDRPGELGLALSGATPEELFGHAASGVTALLADPETVRPGGLRDRLAVRADGPEALLAAWLNEVVRQFAVNRIVIAEVPSLSIRKPAPGGRWSLEALVDGELLDPGRHGLRRTLKAVSHRGLSLGPDGGGWRATAFFDL